MSDPKWGVDPGTTPPTRDDAWFPPPAPSYTPAQPWQHPMQHGPSSGPAPTGPEPLASADLASTPASTSPSLQRRGGSHGRRAHWLLRWAGDGDRGQGGAGLGQFLRQARAWTLAHLDELQPDVLEADRACKTTGSPDSLIAERLILTIAGRARRLGL